MDTEIRLPSTAPVALYTHAEVLAATRLALTAGINRASENLTEAGQETLCSALVAFIPEPDIPRPYMIEALSLSPQHHVPPSVLETALSALRGTQESLQILLSGMDGEPPVLPPDSAAHGCVRGAFIGVPDKLRDAIATLERNLS